MYQKLQSYIDDLDALVNEIPDERKRKLEEIANYIRSKDQPKLTFICTHNSRRSHLCQIWAAAIADYFGIDNVETYSGGTEATAFNPRAVAGNRKGRV
ncbi:hypothetical protein [Fodinibius sp.]|uniref:hypothetical protein n=1 Tax=Fodinibius sp. TaxID=1872440 RepID=UPI002ACDA385|nr:hypothetical protein [Fodinibius sp.]MDZ7659387.1 hypothetical protein [Fodinibius sp.]